MASWYRAALIAPTLTCAVGLAACGGAGNNSATASGGGNRLKGKPVKIMAMGPSSSTTVALPSIKVGAQVAVNEVNANGGVNGRPLELVLCNDQDDPNGATDCARTAIEDHVIALVGGFTAFEPQVVPVLQ